MNQFSRTEMLLGREALLKLQNSAVIVIGLGGVGSYAAEALARAGIGRLALVDGDTVGVTNINRQLVATHKTIGKFKADVMRERILEINPGADVEAFRLFYGAATAGEIDFTRYSCVADAIDTVTSKLLLIQNAYAANVPVISCMGAGNKLDPTMFEAADIYETSVCPLAKVMRRELKARGVERLRVVYSREPAMRMRRDRQDGDSYDAWARAARPLPSADADADGMIPGKRPVPGSVSFVPPVAGMVLAGEVIKGVLGINVAN